jgi:hypothetical protein
VKENMQNGVIVGHGNKFNTRIDTTTLEDYEANMSFMFTDTVILKISKVGFLKL